MEKAFLVKISGRVTGVGFRYSALHRAVAIPGLKGYVRNLGYGEVEVMLQGGEPGIEQMLAWLKRGPSMARVDRVDLVPVPVNPRLEGFVIR